MPAAENTRVEITEETRVFLRRYEEARRFGFCQVDARLWAESGEDVEKLRRLRRDGCPPRLAARILL